MKKYLTLIAIACAWIASPARTFNVSQGGVTYSFPDTETGEMVFNDGQTLTIGEKTFSLTDGLRLYVDNSEIAENTVAVSWTSDKAEITIAGNIAQYVTATITGGHVVITQSPEVADDNCGEITYTLAGECADGSFTLSAEYKASIELHGLTLANPSGAAIDIQSGKRTAIRVAEGTVNTLEDGATGSQKAALYCKGHLEFKQKGTLNVTGNKAHAISAKEYIEVKNTTINVLASQKDGINCNQYFLIESGTINIADTADDGIQVAFKDATDREPEDTGAFTIKGGELNITVTADAAKAIKCEGDFVMSKGAINATVSGGGIWDSTKLKTKSSSCIGADGNLNISGGTLTLSATGGGGKGISADGDADISGGIFNITTTGAMCVYSGGKINNNFTGNADNINSDYKSSPKGIKVDGDIVIRDDNKILIETKGTNGEGIESKKTLTINGGDIVIHAYDDGTNSTNATTINGGNIEITTGVGDAIDSNGPIYVNGGYLRVIGAGGSEQGFDAGDGYQIYINGGTMLAAGGGNSAPSSSASTQAYVTLTQAVTPGTTVTISDGDTQLASFVIPDKYGTTSSPTPALVPGGGNWGWGWGGSSGSALLISTPDMVSGQTYTITAGTTTTTSVAKTTGGSSGPGGGR